MILPVAGTGVGAGALYAVRTHKNSYIIGVDTDWSLTYPEYKSIILTSIMKHYDVSVIEAVKAIEEGDLPVGYTQAPWKRARSDLHPSTNLIR